MGTQTNRSNEPLQPGATPAIPVMGRSADGQVIILRTGRTDLLNWCADHEGYRLDACARPTNSELYAADLVIGRPGFPSRHFRALDYFYDARQALRYATRWGRIWVDHQLKNAARSASRLDGRTRQS